MKKVTLSLIFIVILSSYALPSAVAQNDREVVPLSESDYDCFLTLECITSSTTLSDKGWNFIEDSSVDANTQERFVRMNGQNISLTALYDKDGILIHSLYELKNVALPRVIAEKLIDGSHKGWSIINTKKTVRDFDLAKTVWLVTLQNGVERESIKIDYYDLLGFDTTNNLMVDN